MKPKLTPIRIRIFQKIVDFKSANDGNSPTIRYLADKFDCSTSVINYHLDHLEGAGLIERPDFGKSRMIHVVGGEWKAPVAEPAKA